MLSLKDIVFAIVFLSPPLLKRLILRWYRGAQFGLKSHLGWFSSVMGSSLEIGDYSTIKPFTLIRCDGDVNIGSYTEISSFSLIYGCASFQVGNKSYIGPQSLINVSEDVTIGNYVGIGARTMIYTHGSFLPYTEGYWVRFGKVTIGDNVWMAAGVFVHPGITVGDNVFVNSRSVLTKSISSGQVAEGFPAEEIYPIDKLRRPVTPVKRDALLSNILRHFASFIQQTNREVKLTHQEDDAVSLKLNGIHYWISLINSQTDFELEDGKSKSMKTIILQNCSDWKHDITTNDMMIFDFIEMKTTYSKDKMHREFYQFLRMYYGITFEYSQSQ